MEAVEHSGNVGMSMSVLGDFELIYGPGVRGAALYIENT